MDVARSPGRDNEDVWAARRSQPNFVSPETLFAARVAFRKQRHHILVDKSKRYLWDNHWIALRPEHASNQKYLLGRTTTEVELVPEPSNESRPHRSGRCLRIVTTQGQTCCQRISDTKDRMCCPGYVKPPHVDTTPLRRLIRDKRDDLRFTHTDLIMMHVHVAASTTMKPNTATDLMNTLASIRRPCEDSQRHLHRKLVPPNNSVVLPHH